jgi:Fic family protein
MQAFLSCFERKEPTDLVLKTSPADLWFVTIHPFDGGKGHIARPAIWRSPLRG